MRFLLLMYLISICQITFAQIDAQTKEVIIKNSLIPQVYYPVERKENNPSIYMRENHSKETPKMRNKKKSKHYKFFN